MALTYAWPDTTNFTFSSFEAQLLPTLRRSESIFTGRVQTYETPFPIWVFNVTMGLRGINERAEVEAFLNKVRGAANRVQMWHHARPVPRGSLQTNTVTTASKARGDVTLSMTATTGLTLKAGDLLGVTLSAPAIGSALVMVLGDATSSANVLTVDITPLRGAVANGAAVTVVRPTATCVMTEAAKVPYKGATGTEFSLSFVESFA